MLILKPDFPAGNEAIQPIIEYSPHTLLLSEDDLKTSDALLAHKEGDISQAQFDTQKKFLADKLAQSEVNWVRLAFNVSATLR